MGNAALLWNNLVGNGTTVLSTSSAGAFTPVSYLEDPHPARRWMVAAGVSSSPYLDLDFVDEARIDTIALMAPFGSAPTVRVLLSNVALGSSEVYDSGILSTLYDPDYLAWAVLLSQVYTARYMRLSFTGLKGGGILSVGERDVFEWNFAPGWSRGINDNNRYLKGDVSQLFENKKPGEWVVEATFGRISEEDRYDFIEQLDVVHHNARRSDMLWIKNVESDNLSRDSVWGRRIPSRITQPNITDEAVFSVSFSIEERGGLAIIPPLAWVIEGAGIDIDFENNRAWSGFEAATPDSLLTVTRASIGYAENLVGVWSSFANNIARITNKGLLVEELRINSLRNNSMQGAVAGSPGTLPTNWTETGDTGMTRTIVGSGTENGVEYIDIRYNGTTNATSRSLFFDAANQIAALVGQHWTGSFFCKLVGGSLTNISSVSASVLEYNSVPTLLLSGTTAFTPNATLTRVSHTRTLAGATAAFVRAALVLAFSSGVAIDVTLRIGWPQLEQGRFLTSPIRTTSAAVQRNADTVLLIDLGVINSNECSMFAEFTPLASPSVWGAALIPIGWMNTSPSNTEYIEISTAGVVVGAVVAGGVSQFGQTVSGAVTATRTRVAQAIATNNARVARQGTLSVLDSALVVPTGPATRVAIGSSPLAAAGYLSGYYHRVWFTPHRITDTELTTVTT